MDNDALFGMPKTPGEDQKLVSGDDGQAETHTVNASGDALVLADGLHAIAEAIREFTKVYSAEIDQEFVDEPQPQYDMAGKPIS